MTYQEWLEMQLAMYEPYEWVCAANDDDWCDENCADELTHECLFNAYKRLTKPIKVNGKEIIGEWFAYDECHKIYVCEDVEDIRMMKDYGYRIFPIHLIQECYESSCPLRFIENAKLDKTYVSQCEEARWE